MGCAGPSQSKNQLAATSHIQQAAVALEKAKAAGDRSKVKIKTGEDAIASLRKTATKEQKPHVDSVHRSIEGLKEENEIMMASLQIIEPKLMATQIAVDRLGGELSLAKERAIGYERLKLWLSLFVGAGSAYVAFRLVPGVLGPVRFYAMGGSAIIFGALTYWIL